MQWHDSPIEFIHRPLLIMIVQISSAPSLLDKMRLDELNKGSDIKVKAIMG